MEMNDGSASFQYLDNPINLGEHKGAVASANPDSIANASGRDDSRHCNFEIENSEPTVSWKHYLFLKSSESRFLRKVFISEYASKNEGKSTIIHPLSWFRIIWQLIMILLLWYNLVYIPVSVAFYNDDLETTKIVINCMCDFIFLLDVLVNFRTGIMKTSEPVDIILVDKKVAMHYLITWFTVDLASCLPFDYIFLLANTGSSRYSTFIHAGRALRKLRTAKILSLIRILRIFRLVRYVLALQQIFNIRRRFLNVINVVVFAMLMIHFSACTQFLIPMLQNFPEYCWVQQTKIIDKTALKQYIWSLLKASADMFSSPVGQYNVVMVGDQLVTVTTRILAAGLFAIFVAHLIRAIIYEESTLTKYEQKMKQIERFLKQKEFPESLQSKVIDYVHYSHLYLIEEESMVMDQLSGHLKKELMEYNLDKLLKSNILFNAINGDFRASLMVELESEVYQPRDIIIKEGTVGSKMYFIKEGAVDVITNDGHVISGLSSGSTFGELSLLTASIRMANVQAKTHCHLYALGKDKFMTLLKNHPLDLINIEAAATNISANIFSSSIWKKLAGKYNSDTINWKTFDIPNERIGMEDNGQTIELRLQKIISDIKLKHMPMSREETGHDPCGNYDWGMTGTHL